MRSGSAVLRDARRQDRGPGRMCDNRSFSADRAWHVVPAVRAGARASLTGGKSVLAGAHVRFALLNALPDQVRPPIGNVDGRTNPHVPRSIALPGAGLPVL